MARDIEIEAEMNVQGAKEKVRREYELWNKYRIPPKTDLRPVIRAAKISRERKCW